MTGVETELFPAIDLLDGKAVRLMRGDYNSVTVYNEDPVAQAISFKEAGARWLHVVDLDAARDEGKNNRTVIAEIIRESGLKVEVGGGIRDMQVCERLLEAGASRVVMGTSLITNKDFVRAAIQAFGELICAAIDARNGMVAISGWQQTSSVPAMQLAKELATQGVRHFLYTDINRDGLQTGIDIEAYRKMSDHIALPVIVSGGVASLDDIRAVKRLEDKIEAVIVGRALYEGNFSIEAAMAVLCS